MSSQELFQDCVRELDKLGRREMRRRTLRDLQCVRALSVPRRYDERYKCTVRSLQNLSMTLMLVLSAAACECAPCGQSLPLATLARHLFAPSWASFLCCPELPSGSSNRHRNCCSRRQCLCPPSFMYLDFVTGVPTTISTQSDKPGLTKTPAEHRQSKLVISL